MLGKLPVLGRPTIWIIVGQGPTALAVGAGGGCLDIVTLIYPFFPLSPSLWVWGWSGGAKVLGKLTVLGRPTSLDDGRARAYCARSRCGWGFVWIFFLSSILFSVSLSLEDGPIETEILSQRTVKPKTTNPLFGRRPDID